MNKNDFTYIPEEAFGNNPDRKGGLYVQKSPMMYDSKLVEILEKTFNQKIRAYKGEPIEITWPQAKKFTKMSQGKLLNITEYISVVEYLKRNGQNEIFENLIDGREHLDEVVSLEYNREKSSSINPLILYPLKTELLMENIASKIIELPEFLVNLFFGDISGKHKNWINIPGLHQIWQSWNDSIIKREGYINKNNQKNTLKNINAYAHTDTELENDLPDIRSGKSRKIPLVSDFENSSFDYSDYSQEKGIPQKLTNGKLYTWIYFDMTTRKNKELYIANSPYAIIKEGVLMGEICNTLRFHEFPLDIAIPFRLAFTPENYQKKFA